MAKVQVPSKAPFETISHVHSSLGSLKGRLFSKYHSDGTAVTHPIAQFRSIPYATIPARFKQSILCENGLPEQFDERLKGDFTNYGYACPQIPQPRDACGGYLPGEEERRYHESSCLNLTISAPVSFLPKDGDGDPPRLLPVMVYVHGGGLIEGAGHISGLHETVKMAELATREDMGVITVNIGYRVNFFGFLACNDLLEEREGDEPVFNQGIRDQRNAFAWIKKYIRGFGGDPNNITAFGESAGSISIGLHLSSNVPVFNRAILQSALPASIQDSTFENSEKLYQELLKYFSIQEDTPVKRLDALRAVPAEKIVDAIRDLITVAITFHAYDNDFFPRKPTYITQGDIMANCSWVDSIIIGDTFYEGYMFNSQMKLAHPPTFVTTIKTALGEKHGKAILDQYEISDNGDMDFSRFLTQSMELMGDFVLSEQVDTVARELAEKTKNKDMTIYRYSFGLQNPFPGSVWTFATGHHFVDLMYMFLTTTTRYPSWRNKFLEQQAMEFARKWIKFANGIAPWTPYNLEEGNIAICDYIRGWETRSQREDQETSMQDPWGPRRYAGWEAIRNAWKSVYTSASEGAAGEAAVEAARNIVLNFKSFREQSTSIANRDIKRIHAG